MTMASGNFISSTGTNLNLYVTWSSTANVSTNKSSVTAKVYMRSYTISGSALADSYITINGNKKSFAGKSLAKTSSTLTDTLLAEHTVSVDHGSDGKKSITITANLEFNGTVSGKYLSDITASKTVALDTIPRASGLSVATSVNTGSNLTATISPASSAFTHKIAYIVGNTTMFTSAAIPAGTNTYTHKIEHSWLPKLNSANMVVRLFTFSSSTQNTSTQIGITDKSVTINVPEGIVPTVSNLTATVVNGLGGYYVKGKSQVKLTATATAGNGSVLSSYVFSGPNISGNTSGVATTSATVTSSVIKTDGNLTYGVIAKDERPQRSSQKKEVSITVYPYANPQITSFTAQRCLADGTLDSNGTYAKITVKTSHSSVNGANKRVLTLYSSKDNYAAGTVVLASTNNATEFSGVYKNSSGAAVEFAVGSSYTIRAIITDSYNTSTTIQKSAVLKVAERTINIAKYGNGVSIGGLSTVTTESASGLFEVNWPTKIVSTLNTTGNISTTGSFGNTNTYNASNFAIYCQWADASNHDLLVRGADGLTVGLGWVGSATYETILDVRPRTMRVRGNASFEKNVWIKNDQSYRAYLADGSDTINLIKLTDANSVVIGDLEKTAGAYISGVYNVTSTSAANMFINSGSKVYRSTASSERYKKDIHEIQSEDLNPNKLYDLSVKEFKFKDEYINSNDIRYDKLVPGFIAEEVAEIYPIACEYDNDKPEDWNVRFIVPAMLKLIQDQKKEIEALKEQINNKAVS